MDGALLGFLAAAQAGDVAAVEEFVIPRYTVDEPSVSRVGDTVRDVEISELVLTTHSEASGFYRVTVVDGEGAFVGIYDVIANDKCFALLWGVPDESQDPNASITPSTTF